MDENKVVRDLQCLQWHELYKGHRPLFSVLLNNSTVHLTNCTSILTASFSFLSEMNYGATLTKVYALLALLDQSYTC